MKQEDIIKRMEERHKMLRIVLNECPEVILTGSSDLVLRTKTNEVPLEEGIEIGNKLQKILEKYRKISGVGRGLAAPQIGLNKSVFVTYVDNVFKTYINPVIMEYSEDFYCYKELCLSCVYTVADVKRPRSIVIEYTNEKGERVTDKVDSFLGRLLQHEYDHLQGTLNIDVAEKGGLSDSLFLDPLKEELREC